MHPQKKYLAWSSGAMFTKRAKLWDDRKKHLRTNLPTKNLRVAPILWFHRLKSKMKIQGKSRDFQSICEEIGQNLAEVENSLSQGVVWRTSCRKSRVCLRKKDLEGVFKCRVIPGPGFQDSQNLHSLYPNFCTEIPGPGHQKYVEMFKRNLLLQTLIFEIKSLGCIAKSKAVVMAVLFS